MEARERLLTAYLVLSQDSYYCASHVPVQSNFRRYYFYFLPDQSQTHIDHWKGLDELWCKISFKSDKGKEFPHRPHCKNWPLSATL